MRPVDLEMMKIWIVAFSDLWAIIALDINLDISELFSKVKAGTPAASSEDFYMGTNKMTPKKLF